jgi:hypothetical protein
MILEHVDTNKCTDEPTVTIGPGNTYTVSCTDANGCPCTGSGSWTVNTACTLETEPFSVCPGVTVTKEMILEHVDTNKCTDEPTVTIVSGNTYTVSCTDANGCPCTGSGSWTVNTACIIETETFSVPCNTVPTDDEILAHVDLNSECADAPVITRGTGNTYTVSCTNENGCPCSGSGSWTVEPCGVPACETAWAKPNNDGTTCFPGTGNWGWYVKIPAGTIARGGVFETSGDVWAGAAKCDLSKGTDVGEMSISLTANNVAVEFTLADDCDVTDLHVWASNDYPAGPGFNKWYKSGDITFKTPLKLNKDIYLAVHSQTCCLKCADKEYCTYT